MRVADPVSSGRGDVKLEELMVVPCTTDGECFVAVGRERVARVGGDVDHALGAMVRFGVLSCGALDFQEVLDSAGAFIVQDVEFGLVVDCLEFRVDAGEGLDHAGVFSGFHGAE